jgi:hypothetical protein
LATWDKLRLQIDKGPATVADGRRFAKLTYLCEDLSDKVGLGRELTIYGGFLRGSAADRILRGTWQEVAEGW